MGQTGQLYFLNQDNHDIDDFYVPRIVDIREINRLDRERAKGIFLTWIFVKENSINLTICKFIMH